MDDRVGSFRRATWANLAGNTLKIVVEGGIGLTFGSAALVANAGHSVADLVASIVVHIWGPTAFADPDAEHQHGHERFEPLTALFAGGILVPLGLLLLYESIQKLLTGAEPGFSPYLLGALVFSMVDMYLVYRYTEHINRTVDASSLRSLARDCLNDFYTIIAALVGVIGVWFGYPALDPLAGGLISLVVVREGIELSRENIDYLLDRAPPADTQQAIREMILDHPDVLGIHDFTTYYSGTSIEVEFHAEVDRTQTLDEIHGLEIDVRRRLHERYDIGDVHIHLDPSDPDG
ncbi:MAG TPA: cation diffusion facilitator family transporter [Halococcus sp.]|nr:cation diffusion facilitator family transporter [Halococcus sp.]